MKRNLMLLASALCAAAFTAVAPAVEIKIYHVAPEVSPDQMIANMFKEKVEAKTNGSVVVTPVPNAADGSEKALQEGVRDGTVDMAVAATFHHVVPWAGILECPLLYRDMDHFVNAFAGPIGKDLGRLFDQEAGIKIIFIAPHGGFRYISTKGVPIRKPADMVGLKLRNPNVPVYNIMAGAVGAEPIAMDFSRVYKALEQGEVQGQHNPTLNFAGGKLYEVQDYFIMLPWGITPHIVSMSKKAWDALTPDQQKAVMEAGEETTREYPAVAKKAEEEWLERLKQTMTIIRPEEIDFNAFLEVFKTKGVPELEKQYGPDVMAVFESIVELN